MTQLPKYSRIHLLPIACVFILCVLFVMQTGLNKKHFRMKYIMTRLKQPMDIIFGDNDGNQTYTAVTLVWTQKQTSESVMPSESSSQKNDKSVIKTQQIRENLPKENVVDEKFQHEREMVYKERLQRIKKVCNKLGSTVSFGSFGSLPLNRFRWLNSRQLIMCFNAKVGTSSWSHYLLDIAKPGLTGTSKALHVNALKFLVPPFGRKSPKTAELMKTFEKIMIVRHPFARIVSAYLDKIVRRRFKGVADHIVRNYRPSNSSLKPGVPTFKEFVRYLVHTTPVDDNVKRKYHKVTDIHWRPFYANCAPCDLDYNVILVKESLDEDTRYVIHRYNLEVKEQLQGNHVAPNSSEVSAINLFKKLPNDLIMDLYQRYRVDFEMFGYSVTPFLSTT